MFQLLYFFSRCRASCLLQLSQLASLEALHSSNPTGLVHLHCSNHFLASKKLGELVHARREIPEC